VTLNSVDSRFLACGAANEIARSDRFALCTVNVTVARRSQTRVKVSRNAIRRPRNLSLERPAAEL